MMKELLRRILFYVSFFTDSEFRATTGTLRWKFMDWLYEGTGEPEFNVQWPDDTDPDTHGRLSS